MKFQIVLAVLLAASNVFAAGELGFGVKKRSNLTQEEKNNLIDFIKLSPEKKSLDDAETIVKIMRAMSLAAKKIASTIAQEEEQKDKGDQGGKGTEGDDQKDDNKDGTTEQGGETTDATERIEEEEENRTEDGNGVVDEGEQGGNEGRDGEGNQQEEQNEGRDEGENKQEDGNGGRDGDGNQQGGETTDGTKPIDEEEQNGTEDGNLDGNGVVDGGKPKDMPESNLHRVHSVRTSERFIVWFVLDDKDVERKKLDFTKAILFFVVDVKKSKAMPADGFRKKSEELKKEILQAATNAKLAVEVTVLEKGLPIWVYVAISVGVVALATCVTVLLVVLARRRRNTDF